MRWLKQVRRTIEVDRKDVDKANRDGLNTLQDYKDSDDARDRIVNEYVESLKSKPLKVEEFEHSGTSYMAEGKDGVEFIFDL